MGVIVTKVRRLYPVFRNKRFANYAGEPNEPILRRSCGMFFRTVWNRLFYTNTLHTWLEPQPCIPSSHDNRSVITWIGHATFVINVAGLNIITDPVFGNVSGVISRLVPPGIHVADLPTIDVILISHNHYDHMDERSLCYLRDRNPHVRVFVPYGDKAWFTRRGFTNVQEYAWWESETMLRGDQSVRCTFLPAYHWSQRGVFDRNQTLWGSWMIEGPYTRIYFAGDTAYGPHFRNIAHFFPHIDVALMPIAPTEPRWWMSKSHILPEQSVDAFLELHARHFIPMHWGTFWFGVEMPLQGLWDLYAAWREHAHRLHRKELNVLRFGQSCYIDTTTQAMQYNSDIIRSDSLSQLHV